jgi:hypothetical protein
MARTRLTVQSVSAVGGNALTFSPVDTVNGMQIQNSGRVALVIQTGTGAGVTVAIPSVACIHGRLGNISAVVPQGVTETFGPFQDPTIWGDGRDQLLADFSAAIGGTAVNTVAAVQMV